MSKPVSALRTLRPMTRLGRRRRAAVNALLAATAIELSAAPSMRNRQMVSPWASATSMTAALPSRASSARMVSTAVRASSSPSVGNACIALRMQRRQDLDDLLLALDHLGQEADAIHI